MKKKKGKERKNFQFDLFGSTWHVVFVKESPLNNKDNEEYCNLGYTNSTHNEITIATADQNGKELSDDQIEVTLLHELVHAILFTGQYSQEGGSEPLVEWVARCLKSMLNQNVFEYARK